MMYLEDEEISLRALEEEDVDIIYEWENDSTLWIHGSTISPYSKLAIREYIRNAQDADIYQSRQLRLMIVLKDSLETIGSIDLYDFEPKHDRIGVGIMIEKEFREKKYAYNALKLVEEYVFNFLHLHQIYAFVSVKNKASVNLFLKTGYVQTAILNDWIRNEDLYENVLVLQRTKK